MPRPPLSNAQKLATARARLAEVLSHYVSAEELIDAARDHRITSSESTKIHQQRLLSMQRHNRTIRSLSSDQPPREEQQTNNDIENRDLTHNMKFCDNCFRQELTQDEVEISRDQTHVISFIERDSNSISTRRRFKNVRASTNNVVTLTLCEQCNSHLEVKEAQPKYNDFKFTWPAYIWYILTDRKVLAAYPAPFLWKLIPKTWRKWWLPALKRDFSRYYEFITLDLPAPIIIDRSLDLSDWTNCLEINNLPSVAKTCNEHLLPTVLCPWGCTEYIHKHGSIPMYSILQKYLPKVQLPLTTRDNFKKVTTARDDYIRNDIFDYDNWLLNPQWKVLPSIIIDPKEGPVIMTCHDHHNGNPKYMIHTCRQPHHILPASRPDQLAPCVNRPRTVKPVKKSKFSTTYQMHEQKGSFNGIDTCSVTLFGKFNFKSTLSAVNDARAMSQRPDIFAHLQTLVKEKVVSKWCAEGRAKDAMASSRNINFEPYYEASTYIPMHIALAMQKENANPRYANALGNEHHEGQTFNFKIAWPEYIYPCQTLSDHGVHPHLTPKLTMAMSQNNSADLGTVRNLPYLWLISSIVLSVENVWHKVSTKETYCRNSWEGWMLMYLSKKCLHHLSIRPDNTNPFKYHQVSSVKSLGSKTLPSLLQENDDPKHLADVFMNLPGTLCVDFDGLIEYDNLVDGLIQSILPNHHDVIIIENFVKSNEQPPLRFESNDGSIYELRYVSNIQWTTDTKWETEISVRHGNNQCGWWYATRNSNVYVQKRSFHPMKDHLPYYLVYVLSKSTDMMNASVQVMSHIGGQSKVCCHRHNLPMILSTFRKGKCFCSRTEYYRCPDFNCNIKCCKRCLDRAVEENVSHISHEGYVGTRNRNNVESNDNSGIGIDGTTEGTVEIDPEELFQDNTDDDSIQTTIHDTDATDEIPDHDNPSYSPLLRDDFNEYVTTAEEPNFNSFSDTFDEFATTFEESPIPSTDAGIYPFDITENIESTGALNDIVVTGNVLLNQCGTLLTRNSHQIKGSSRGKLMMQKICATTIGHSVPLLQPEAALFPSIFWKMVPNDGVISGAIPTPLLSERTVQFGFQSLPQHVRSRLTSASSTTSTDPNYITHGFDLLTNLSATHLDTRVAMNRGLTAGSDTLGGLGVRGSNDSSGAALLGSIDSNQMVKNLCASQRIHPSSFFCTFTCAQSQHFGTKIIKEWIDGNKWKDNFNNFYELCPTDQREIGYAVQQGAAGLLLRNWQETCKIFLDYLRKSPSSPFKRVGSIFARNEYQKDVGNLSHIHLMIEVKWDELTQDEKKFVDNLICANHLDICPPEDLEKYINEGIFDSVDDGLSLQEYAKRILRHVCSSRCQERVGPYEFRCRHTNNCRDSPDPKNDVFVPLPNDISDAVKERLVMLGMMDPTVVNELRHESPFHCKDPFFHPTRHIPATNPSEDINMSPVERYTFSVCKSMQNIQLIRGTGGCNKYVCKYVGKIDEQNYVIVKANPNSNGDLITQSNFLHNTKVTGSKINEDQQREKNRDKNKPTGRRISLMEMLHVILKYPEVYTDLQFVDVPTYPLAFRKSTGVSAKRNPHNQSNERNINNGTSEVEDAADAEPFMISHRNGSELPEWRRHTNVETTLIKDLYSTGSSIDAITRFSIRPPELRNLFNATGDYFRWFSYSQAHATDSYTEQAVNNNHRFSSFIDGIQYQVKVRQNAVREISEYLSGIEQSNRPLEDVLMIQYFQDVCNAVMNNFPETDEQSILFNSYVKEHVVDLTSNGLLPVYVFSQIRPTGGINFILHILLSMGRFNNEIELTVHESLRECLREAKLIGPLNDPESLQQYSNNLLDRYISEQLKYFSNSRGLIMHWIEVAAAVFDSVILRDEIPVTEMPPVQLTSILAIKELAEEKFLHEMKLKLATAVLKEVGSSSTMEGAPSLHDVMSASKESPFVWNPIECHIKNPLQSEESYQEQQFAIKVTCSAIDQYTSLSSNVQCTKNIGIRGFPGGGKTWCAMYCMLYALSKGLSCLATAVMAKRATQLGGCHWHKFFCLPVEKRLTPHRIAEISINKLLLDKVRHNAVMTLDVIVADEFGQLSSEFISAIDIILRNLRRSNTIFGGVLIIGTLDHTQIQPWEGRPFLTSPQIIPTFKMVNLQHSVRTNDVNSQRIQTIARMNYKELKSRNELVEEFTNLASDTFQFVSDWEHPSIVPSTFRVYSKKVPAVQAAREFISNVERTIPAECIRTRMSEDLQKARYTTSAWRNATQDTSNRLEEKVKSPKQLLFFRGAVYECTYNHKDGLFSQSQIALLYDLPEEETVRSWKPIKVLIAPPAQKDVQFDMSLPKEHYIQNGFVEMDIHPCPDRSIFISRTLQAQRKQYGLKHRVTGTIHAAMGDTYDSMATMISETDPNFGLWDKGQLIVILSRTRDPKKTIFVGDKTETLRAFRSLLLKRTQWTDFMEHILSVITINSLRHEIVQYATPEHYPFQVCDMELPQCNTGFVYMLSSLRKPSYTYIGATDCIRSRIIRHNSGFGSRSTTKENLRPFAIMAYICGFGRNRELMFSIEQKWKIRRNELMSDGNNDPRNWARCGNDVISQVEGDVYNTGMTDLKLVTLFR